MVANRSQSGLCRRQAGRRRYSHQAPTEQRNSKRLHRAPLSSLLSRSSGFVSESTARRVYRRVGRTTAQRRPATCGPGDTPRLQWRQRASHNAGWAISGLLPGEPLCSLRCAGPGTRCRRSTTTFSRKFPPVPRGDRTRRSTGPLPTRSFDIVPAPGPIHQEARRTRSLDGNPMGRRPGSGFDGDRWDRSISVWMSDTYPIFLDVNVELAPALNDIHN
jgi:hypothetical protein